MSQPPNLEVSSQGTPDGCAISAAFSRMTGFGRVSPKSGPRLRFSESRNTNEQGPSDAGPKGRQQENPPGRRCEPRPVDLDLRRVDSAVRQLLRGLDTGDPPRYLV